MGADSTAQGLYILHTGHTGFYRHIYWSYQFQPLYNAYTAQGLYIIYTGHTGHTVVQCIYCSRTIHHIYWSYWSYRFLCPRQRIYIFPDSCSLEWWEEEGYAPLWSKVLESTVDNVDGHNARVVAGLWGEGWRGKGSEGGRGKGSEGGRYQYL